MAYRIYINDIQLFGNNEYYPEWITYMKQDNSVIAKMKD